MTAGQHHAWMEIDLAQFSQNLSRTQQLIGDSKLCAVMKADAYGLGISNLLPTIIAQQIPYIAITNHSEIVEIRRHQPAFQGKILRIRTASRDEIIRAIPYHVEEMLGHIDNAMILSECAQAADTIIDFHLKINSAGMGRNGLDLSSEDGRQEALAILALPGLRVVGLMTHFPKEDAHDINASLIQFQSDCQWLIEHGQLDREQLCIHAANSYAVLTNPDAHLDMVRPGSLIYGDGFLPEFEGFPYIFSFKSQIASINTYTAGSTISYEREHVVKRDSRIATVLVGYADGYRRCFSHKGQMLVRGQKAPLVGRISMNVSTLDVTDIADAAIGDEVVIFGRQGQASIDQAEMEAINQALFADLYTVWGRCNPKVIR